jgi:hypothetical protein
MSSDLMISVTAWRARRNTVAASCALGTGTRLCEVPVCVSYELS